MLRRLIECIALRRYGKDLVDHECYAALHARLHELRRSADLAVIRLDRLTAELDARDRQIDLLKRALRRAAKRRAGA